MDEGKKQMGAMKEQKINKKHRRATSSPSTPKQRATWAGAPAELLWLVVKNITESGGAVRFGLTRDGGAYAVGIYDNGEHETEYLKPSDDLRAYLEELAAAFEDQPGGSAGA
jgi:hypothetical protein